METVITIPVKKILKNDIPGELKPLPINESKTLEDLRKNNTISKIDISRGHIRFLMFQPVDRLEELPPSFSNLSFLKHLVILSNDLTELPNDFGKLQSLEKLDLCAQIKELPGSFGELSRLVDLSLRGNGLRNLPDWFQNLQRLTYLDLGRNNFSEIPPSIFNIRQLRILSLAGNQIGHIPEEIGNLTNLVDLDVSYNQIHSFPASIVHLRLKRLSVSENPIQRPLSPEIIQWIQNTRARMRESR